MCNWVTVYVYFVKFPVFLLSSLSRFIVTVTIICSVTRNKWFLRCCLCFLDWCARAYCVYSLVTTLEFCTHVSFAEIVIPVLNFYTCAIVSKFVICNLWQSIQLFLLRHDSTWGCLVSIWAITYVHGVFIVLSAFMFCYSGNYYYYYYFAKHSLHSYWKGRLCRNQLSSSLWTTQLDMVVILVQMQIRQQHE